MTNLSRRRLLQAAGAGAATLVVPRMPAVLAAPATTAVAIVGDPLGPGYWVLLSDGSVSAKGSARSVGGARGSRGVATDLAAHPTGGGFWRVKRSGAVSAFHRASVAAGPAQNRRGRVVGVAANPAGSGLWRVTAQGQVLATGKSKNLGAPKTDARITAIAAHPEAAGYWILARTGRVFGFGASRVLGRSAGRGATGIAAHPGGDGYWVVRANGTVTAYGASRHHGNAALATRAVDIAAAPDGEGYWVLGADGRVAAFGSAKSGVISTSPQPEPRLATVAGIVVAGNIERPLTRMVRKAKRDGVTLAGWGYRSHARQVELRRQNCGPRYYDIYVKPSRECSPMTAVPGNSMHEKGLAIDFHHRRADGSYADFSTTRAFKWLKRHAKDFGFYNLPSEPWHWSTNGR